MSRPRQPRVGSVRAGSGRLAPVLDDAQDGIEGQERGEADAQQGDGYPDGDGCGQWPPSSSD